MNKNKRKIETDSGTAKAVTSKNDFESKSNPSKPEAVFVHLICGVASAFALAVISLNLFSISLVSDSSSTLFLLWAVNSPIVILFYSRFRWNPSQCSYLRAIVRGVLGLPVGALLIALGAIALGAPVGIQYLTKTTNWSVLMSSMAFVPAACVFGPSWSHWQRIFAYTKPNGSLDCMICIPAHGAIIGAWFGAWPMPLDWERPWQEWPICVTYGALIGYLIGTLVSMGFILAVQMPKQQQHTKGD